MLTLEQIDIVDKRVYKKSLKPIVQGFKLFFNLIFTSNKFSTFYI